MAQWLGASDQEVKGSNAPGGMVIFSAVVNVSTRSANRVQCYIVVSPLVCQFQPTPAGFTATHNHSGVAGIPSAIILAAV